MYACMYVCTRRFLCVYWNTVYMYICMYYTIVFVHKDIYIYMAISDIRARTERFDLRIRRYDSGYDSRV